MSFLKKIIFSLPIVGYARGQRFFERLHGFALSGMNIGIAGEIYNDGELTLLRRINNEEHAKGRKEKMVLFDVGTNIGLYTKALVKEFGASASIYSFEPSQKTFTTLSQNILADPICKGVVQVFNVGLGSTEEKVTLFSDKENSGLASIYERKMDHFNISMNRKETITLTTLDMFCEKNGIKKIDFLKMDVEGNELNVLKGAKKMLAAGAVQRIQFEFGGNNIDSRTFFQDFYYLLKDDFNLYRLVKDGGYPIVEYREVYECFVCTTFFAEKK